MHLRILRALTRKTQQGVALSMWPPAVNMYSLPTTSARLIAYTFAPFSICEPTAR